MTSALWTDPDLGTIARPVRWDRLSVYRGGVARRAAHGELGIIVTKQRRPVYNDCGRLVRYEVIWADVSHNERVNQGALLQAQQVFGGGSGPTAPSATNYPQAVAIASATLTKTATDLSLGSASSAVTTNEYTTIGLSRAAATVVAGNYTAPASLGATFAQVMQKVFTATGSGTAYGIGLFDRVAVASSNLYAEDNFGSTAVLVTNDQLTASYTFNN